MKKKVFSAFMLFFIVIVLGGCSLFKGESLQPLVLTSSEAEQRIQVISETYPEAVVTIFTYEDVSNNSVSMGSGVVVREDGFIATNFHVISKIVLNEEVGYNAKVAFNQSSALYPATIEWYNMALDLAIVKVDKQGLNFVPMKDRSIFVDSDNHYRASEFVVAIGTPIDFSLQNTVTVGRISSKVHRIAYAEGNAYEDLIQHTAPINHGNSGGGLFDLDGNLIGLNTLGSDAANSLFFAVPIFPVIEVLDKVVNAYYAGKTHSAGMIGVIAIDRHQAIKEDGTNFNQEGMIVLSVLEDGAALGKVFVGDIIKEITTDDKKTKIDIRNNLVFALLKTTPGETITLKIQRDIIVVDVTIILR